MEADIIDVIAGLVRGDGDLESRLEYQAGALRETRCIKPIVGRRIDEIDVDYLFSAFALEDQDFAVRFPSMADVSRAERKMFIETFASHLEECLHCSLRRGYDLELNARIKRACNENRNALLRLLEDDGTTLSEQVKVGA